MACTWVAFDNLDCLFVILKPCAAGNFNCLNPFGVARANPWIFVILLVFKSVLCREIVGDNNYADRKMNRLALCM